MTKKQKKHKRNRKLMLQSTTMLSGRYKNVALKDIPRHYLEWYVENVPHDKASVWLINQYFKA